MPCTVRLSKRLGVTLVELLVVIAIISLLVALLLPAVQSARESARRIECSNNLKQVALATTQYGDAHRGTFPVGEYSWGWGTWLVALLPYLEQKALFDQYQGFGGINDSGGIDTNLAYSAPVNLPVTRIQLKIYTCPSDSTTARSSNLGGITYHNYVANHGNTTLRPHAEPGDSSDVERSGGKVPTRKVKRRPKPQPSSRPDAPDPPLNLFRGAPFIYVESTMSNPQVVRFAEVFDGLSNTLAFSETVQGHSSDLRGFAWWKGGSHFESLLLPNSSQPDILENIAYCVASDSRNPPCTASTSASGQTSAARSRHPGGVMVAMCDGSVRFVSNTIDLFTWRAASTIYGKESPGDF